MQRTREDPRNEAYLYFSTERENPRNKVNCCIQGEKGLTAVCREREDPENEA